MSKRFQSRADEGIIHARHPFAWMRFLQYGFAVAIPYFMLLAAWKMPIHDLFDESIRITAVAVACLTPVTMVVLGSSLKVEVILDPAKGTIAFHHFRIEDGKFWPRPRIPERVFLLNDIEEVKFRYVIKSGHQLRLRFPPGWITVTNQLRDFDELYAAINQWGKSSSRFSVPAPECPMCGYNLTGNQSGCCPECSYRLRRRRFSR